MYFYLTNKSKSGENAKCSDGAPRGGLETRHFKPFSQKLAVRPGRKFWELVKQYEEETVNIFFKKIYRRLFQLLSKYTKIDVFAICEKPEGQT